MDTPIAAQVLAAFHAEQSSLRDFVSLLEQEQSVLLTGLGDELLDLAEKKSACATRLTSLVATRHTLLQNTLPELNNHTIQTWLEHQAPTAWPVWQDICKLADRAQHLNQSSGELIQLKLRHNQQALGVLSNAASKANLYGRDGQPNFSAGNGRPIASV